jgi:hypothetical protein
MRRGSGVTAGGIALALWLASGTSRAATPAADESSLAPANGFQLAVGAGLLFPIGSATGTPGDRLPARYAWQPGLLVDAGWHFARSFFAGVYAGVGYGDLGNDRHIELDCSDDHVSCHAIGFRFGLEGAYFFRTEASVNPWISLGLGFEGATASIKDSGTSVRSAHSESVTSTGITFVKLAGGFDDHRGKGLFADLALGQYSSTGTDLGDRGDYDYSIEHRRLHAWLMLGARLVFGP